MKTISSKIIIAITVCSLAISILLGTISIRQSSKFIEKEAIDKLVFMAENSANHFSQTFIVTESVIETLSADIFATFNLQKLKEDSNYMQEYTGMINPIIKRAAEITNGVQGIYLGLNPELTGKVYESWYADIDGNGNFILQESEDISAFDPDNEDMEWYYNPIKKGKGVWSEPYIDPTINIEMISYSKAIYKEDILIGVIGIDITIDDIKKMIENIQVYDTGYAFLLDEDYDIVMHPKFNQGYNFKTIENGQLKVTTEEMDKNNSGYIQYKLQGKDKLMGYSHLTNEWILAVAPPLDEIFEPVKNLSFLLTILTFTGIIIAFFVALYVGKSIAKPILKITELTNKTADLDLVYDSSFNAMLKYRDETGIMAKAIGNTRKALREMIESIVQNARNIDEESVSLSAVSEQMASATENVTNAIQDVAKGTSSQADDLIKTNSILNQFGQSLENIIQSIDDIHLNARGVQSMANESSTNMEKVVESVSQTTDSFDDFIVKISALSSNINQITEITNLINNIADQTNLLALNAAIEAARAGENGKGFAVVAEEIRKLAEQSKTSSTNIHSLIDGISNDTNIMVKTTDSMKIEFNKQKVDINVAIDSFEKIIEQIDAINPKIEEANTSVINLDKDKNIIVEKIEGASAIAEETSASSEEIAASSEEMSASAEEVASTAQTLSMMTKEMMEQIDKFKV